MEDSYKAHNLQTNSRRTNNKDKQICESRKAWRKRWVLSCFLNWRSECMLRRLFGSEFQTAGAAKWKERLTRGVFNNLSVDDRNDRAVLYVQSVAVGNVPSKCRNARTANLHWFRNSKGSQWNSYMTEVDHTSSSTWLNEPRNFLFFEVC